LKRTALNKATTMSEEIKELDLDALAKVSAGDFSEMGEMESLRLQMAMDRMSKFMSTLSHLLKQVSVTGSQIAGNLK
jgi:hypothetical protein